MKTTILMILLTTMSNLCLAENYFSNPKKPSAKLILDSQKSTESLASVTLLNINGNEVIPRSNAVWLKPGKYTLKFASNIQNNAVNSGSSKIRNKRKNTPNTLDIILDEGKTYYIAYDTHNSDINKWQPIVWKTE